MMATPASAAGRFRQRAARGPLLGAFASVWVHEMPDAGASPIIVAPDGTIDIQWIDGRFRVAGPDKEPKIEFLPAGAMVIGFRFRPAVAAGWLGVPATRIVGERLDLQELWGAKGRRIADSVRSRNSLAQLVQSLEDLVAQAAPDHDTTDAAMLAAGDLVRTGPPPGTPLVPWLGRALAMSERTLRRRFDAAFGYGPKTLDRILRHQRYLRLSREGSDAAAILAVKAGYSDQAHLVRESRRLTGSTPRQLARLSRAQSDMSAAFAVAETP
jgi:AraC-like DNA-binding protein